MIYLKTFKLSDVRNKNTKISCLITAILIHGFYDFCLSAGDATLIMILIVFLIALDIRAYNTVKASSAQDMHL